MVAWPRESIIARSSFCFDLKKGAEFGIDLAKVKRRFWAGIGSRSSAATFLGLNPFSYLKNAAAV